MFTWWAPVAAAIVAGLVETIPVKLDDNVSVPLVAGAVMALATTVDAQALQFARTVLSDRLAWAVVINVTMAMAVQLAGSLTWTGAITGMLIGIVIYLGAGLSGWILLLLSFVSAVVSSRVGLKQKMIRGIAEAREGRRGAGNAIANCVVGAIGAWLMIVEPSDIRGALVLSAGLIAGASDTVASEIGKAFGGVPRVFPSFQPTAPGTPGAVSAIGTLAGLTAAVVMSLYAGAYLPGGSAIMLPVVIGATAGAFVESALATQFERDGVLNNDVLNFLNTGVAALVAVGVSSWTA
jgi:uncharacterized protein (TIGR00297 family)